MKAKLKAINEGTDRAVSPVIGVILMVAITVILAAVIGTFVLDIGQDAGQTAPQASLQSTLSTTNDEVTVQHRGGDALQATQSRVIITNETSGDTSVWDVGGNPDTLTVGDSAVFNVSTADGNVTGWGISTPADPNDVDGVTTGHQYTITVIDTASERVVFETTLTA